MSTKKRFSISMMAVCLSFSLAACSSQTSGDKPSANPVSSVSESSAKNVGSQSSEASISSDVSSLSTDDTNEPEDYLDECSYSSDNSVCLKITRDQSDADKDVAIVIDGDKEIPVDIATGIYGAYIEKSDCDGDGEDEYLIAECEGTGSGCSQYGLCIVDKEGEDYTLTRYDSSFFSDILARRISTQYDKDLNWADILIDGKEDHYVYSVSLNGLNRSGEDSGEFSGFVWSDIIDIKFLDGKVWLAAPAGVVFSDNNVPDYDLGLNITAPITINRDKTVTVGDIRPYEARTSIGYELDPSSEKESRINTVTCDINRDGIEDAILVTYITDKDFDGNFTESTFRNGAFGHVKIIEGTEDTKNDTTLFESMIPSWMKEYALAHTGNCQVFLSTVDGKDYVVYTSLYDGQGDSDYEYEVFFLKDGYLFQADHAEIEFKTEKKPDLKTFFDGLYKWINDDSVLLMATDIDLDLGVYFSRGETIANPDVYYSQKK